MGLHPSETAYVARTRDRRRLQFSVTGKAEIELAYRTHSVSPALSEAKRSRLAEDRGLERRYREIAAGVSSRSPNGRTPRGRPRRQWPDC